MKLKVLLFAATVFFIACSNDKKSTEIPKQVSTLKSDVLIQSTATKPFSGSDNNHFVSLTLTGKTILESTATFKETDVNGNEILCETYPAKNLIQPEYKTANSVLKEAHIREVVEGYFVDEEEIEKIKNGTLAGI